MKPYIDDYNKLFSSSYKIYKTYRILKTPDNKYLTAIKKYNYSPVRFICCKF